MNTFFSLSTYFVMPFWALIIFLPRWRWTQRIMQVPFFVAILTLLYVILVLPQAGTILPVVTHPSIANVAALLGTPAGATIGWIHFLAFDLFVGRWIYFDSQERRISAWLVSPLLFVTFMLGPLGFLCYFCLRTGFALVRRNVAQGKNMQIGQSQEWSGTEDDPYAAVDRRGKLVQDHVIQNRSCNNRAVKSDNNTYERK